jgi:predicted amidohydrolase YtcJ
VVCCDPLDTIVDTVGIRAGRIVATGDMGSVADAMGDGCRVVGLDGATVIPGLIDTHPHLMGFALVAEPLVDLADAVDHHDIGTRIAAKAAETPPGEWVMTTPVGEAHYFLRRSYRDLTEGEIPDRRVLDRAAPDHPVFVQAWAPVTPNVCAFNSRALALLGIDRTTPDRVENVWIEKDADGEPTGRLQGSVTNYYNGDPFMESLLLQLPLFQLGLLGQATTRAMRAYNALGVTTVYEGHTMDFPLLDAYRALRADGELSVRVLCAPDAIPVGIPGYGPLSREQLLARLEQAAAAVDRTDDLLRFDGVTVGRGGPCGSGWVLLGSRIGAPTASPPAAGRS